MKQSLLILASAIALATASASAAEAANVGVYIGGGPAYVVQPQPVIVEQRVYTAYPTYPTYVGGYYGVAPVYYHRGNRHARDWHYWNDRDRHGHKRHHRHGHRH